MERFIREFESMAKSAGDSPDKLKKIEVTARQKTQAYEKLLTAQQQLNIKDDKVTGVGKRNFETIAAYNNLVYDAVEKNLITQDEAESFLKPVNKDFIAVVQEMKAKNYGKGYGNIFKANELNVFGEGIQDLDNYFKQIGESENLPLKKDFYMALYNGLVDAKVDIKSFNKTDKQIGSKVLEQIKRSYAESGTPELVNFSDQVINQSLSATGGLLPITPTPPQKPAPQKVTMPGYILEQDAQGNRAMVKRDKTGKVIDIIEQKFE